jgi:hypothetical protein
MGLLANIGKRLLGIGSKNPEESTVGTVISRLVPDRNKQKQIMLEIEQQYNTDVMDLQAEIEGMREFEPKFSLFIKGSARWIIAFAFVAFYIYSRLKGISLTEFDIQIVGAIVGFAFLSRGIEKVLGKTK